MDELLEKQEKANKAKHRYTSAKAQLTKVEAAILKLQNKDISDEVYQKEEPILRERQEKWIKAKAKALKAMKTIKRLEAC